MTYWNIQILWYLGIREIYLLGVDHSFNVPQNKIKHDSYEYIIVSSGEKNHFDPNYRPVGETWTIPHLKEQEMAYDYASNFIKAKGGILKNASRKTKLDCIEKVDFDSLF